MSSCDTACRPCGIPTRAKTKPILHRTSPCARKKYTRNNVGYQASRSKARGRESESEEKAHSSVRYGEQEAEGRSGASGSDCQGIRAKLGMLTGTHTWVSIRDMGWIKRTHGVMKVQDRVDTMFSRTASIKLIRYNKQIPPVGVVVGPQYEVRRPCQNLLGGDFPQQCKG